MHAGKTREHMITERLFNAPFLHLIKGKTINSVHISLPVEL